MISEPVQGADAVRPLTQRLNLTAMALQGGWGFIPLSVRYAAAEAADRMIADWFAEHHDGSGEPQTLLRKEDLSVEVERSGVYPNLRCVVRLTHVPTGLMYECGKHQSEIRNKSVALVGLDLLVKRSGWTALIDGCLTTWQANPDDARPCKCTLPEDHEGPHVCACGLRLNNGAMLRDNQRQDAEFVRCFGAVCHEVALFRVNLLKSCCHPNFASHVYCGEHTKRIVKNAEFDNRRVHVEYVGPQQERRNDGVDARG